jgi:transaldolase / glucose-6-phosphate isomerase
VGLSRLVVSAGKLKAAYQKALETLGASDAVGRLWSKDVSLWPEKDLEGPVDIRQLGWLDLSVRLEKTVAQALRAVEELYAEFDDIVFIAMGSANLSADLIPALRIHTRGKRFFVADLIHPTDLKLLDETLDLPRTLFLMTSKTGKVLETHTLFLHFFEQLKAAGVASPARQFIAITEEDSYLQELAAEYGFRSMILDPLGFPGRFSGLIHCTLLFTALCGWDSASLFKDAREICAACGPLVPIGENPAASLGALLAAGAAEGHERLAILTPDGLMPMVYRLGQLVGSSTCCEEQGIVPLFGVRPPVVDSIRGEYMAACLRVATMPDGELDEAVRSLQEKGIPHIVVDVERVEDLCAELYRWEIATCLACVVMKKNPFVECEGKELRAIASRRLEEISARRALTEPRPRIRQEELELYAEGTTRHELSMLSLEEALRSLFTLPQTDGFLALLSFLPQAEGTWERLQSLRARLEAVLRLPVLLNQGPRYLHNAGTSYKVGPAKGAFLMLTGEVEEDIAIPGAEYSFGKLTKALALSDFEAMTKRGEHVARLHFEKSLSIAMGQFQRLCERAQVGIRRASE